MSAINTPLSVLTSNHAKVHEVTRRSAHYRPSIWGDHFLPYSSQQKEVDTQEWEEHQKLKEKVKNMLVAPQVSCQKLELINMIQRLGVSYQFEKEIEATLQHIFGANNEFNLEKDDNDLYAVSLHFRLLRQHGYHVSCSVFEKFTDCDGKFKESLVNNNVKAMLSLYEASHLRVHGEKILDEALTFTTSHLESMLPNLTDPLRCEVIEALKRPIWKRLTRIEARIYISIYELDETHDVLLLKFAKLDFNLLQKEHQKELGNLTRWWKKLDVAKNLSFARDRFVECYFWILGVYFEPKYNLARRFVVKVIGMASIIDDIYDVYGTLDELRLFTDAIQRWDASAVNELPEYMRICYLALLDVYAEMEKELCVKGESYRVNYAKNEMKKLIGAYYEEAKWFYDGCCPKLFDEYMKVALVTGAYMMLATTSLVGMQEDFVTKDALEWVSKDPLIVRAASVICRLMDDMAGHEFEQERGHIDSAVECYMKQYGKTKEETFNVLGEQVKNAWKDINQECLKPIVFPMPILIRVVNFARVIEFLYKDGDSYSHPTTKLKAIITSVLVNPIP